MIRKTAIVLGVGAAVLIGGAGTALAAAAPAVAAAGDTGAKAHAHHRALRGEYATWTTYDAATRTATVHQGARGTVSAVSATSITVRAADGTAHTFAVTAATAVREKGGAGAIGQVATGDRVGVVGTGAADPTATRIADRGAAPAPK